MAERMTILIVEDDAAVLRSLELALCDTFCVLTARTMSDAMRQVSQWHPEVAVLDLNLPDTRGVSTIREMRRFWPAAAIVVYAGDANEAECLTAGAEEILVKPGTIDDMKKSILRAHLRHQSRKEFSEPLAQAQKDSIKALDTAIDAIGAISDKCKK